MDIGGFYTVVELDMGTQHHLGNIDVFQAEGSKVYDPANLFRLMVS